MSAGTLFVGDVHGCADELRDLLGRVRADRVILLGDVFTKGPDPNGVWGLIQEHGAEGIMGNHDARVLDRWAVDGWARRLPEAARSWLSALPLMRRGPGWLAVHAGLDPHRGAAGTSRRQALVLRRFPDDAQDSHPFWWELYAGDGLVIYGHDAVRGLVDRRPHTLGLDSGCVYGGVLTGYLLEADRLVQVPAQRAYRPVS